jgi:hypothetical protein
VSGRAALGVGVAAVGVGTALSYGAALALGRPLAVPVLNTLAAFPVMVWWLRRGRVAPAIVCMLVWAAAMAVAATALARWRPEVTGVLFLRGEPYRREMFAWVRTGAGAESDPRQFVPRHAAELALFAGLSIATGSAASMPMGAVLMNSMGHYAGSLAAAGEGGWCVAAAAWPPWAVLRVASFVVLGVVLAGPVWSRAGGAAFRLRDQTGWLAAAAAGLLADVALKWWLAPWWGAWLRRLVGW